MPYFDTLKDDIEFIAQNSIIIFTTFIVFKLTKFNELTDKPV